MTEPDLEIAIVPVQTGALARRAAATLAKRGLSEIQSLDAAGAWFARAMKLRDHFLDEGVEEEWFECIQRTLALNPQHAGALRWLGYAYQEGEGGLGQDLRLAQECFRTAAETGDAEAQTELGWQYYYGRGFPRDFTEAADWFRKAANQGYAEAQDALGRMYSNGEGVARDLAQAAGWYRKVAQSLYADKYKAGTQVYTAQLSEDVNKDRILRDWRNEPGNDNPPVDFHWRDRQVTAYIHSNSESSWAEDSFKQFFTMVLHRSMPHCKVDWF